MTKLKGLFVEKEEGIIGSKIEGLQLLCRIELALSIVQLEPQIISLFLHLVVLINEFLGRFSIGLLEGGETDFEGEVLFIVFFCVFIVIIQRKGIGVRTIIDALLGPVDLIDELAGLLEGILEVVDLRLEGLVLLVEQLDDFLLGLDRDTSSPTVLLGVFDPLLLDGSTLSEALQILVHLLAMGTSDVHTRVFTGLGAVGLVTTITAVTDAIVDKGREDVLANVPSVDTPELGVGTGVRSWFIRTVSAIAVIVVDL
mmetsp:Transcript_36371/g.60528  ORF Transcript_36371/g.60528 Transcript_36371/m.60528 type:complete len:256 (+) Transcript_36371:335-1102(+)